MGRYIPLFMRFSVDSLPLNIAHDIRDIPPFGFSRFFTENPCALSYEGFCRDSDPLPPRGFRIISKSSIFFSSLLGVTTFTQRLPVIFVPEKSPVTTVWPDVVHLCCRSESSFSLTMNTQGMLHKKLLAGLSPLVGVHFCSPVVLSPNHHLLMFLTVYIVG